MTLGWDCWMTSGARSWIQPAPAFVPNRMGAGGSASRMRPENGLSAVGTGNVWGILSSNLSPCVLMVITPSANLYWSFESTLPLSFTTMGSSFTRRTETVLPSASFWTSITTWDCWSAFRDATRARGASVFS